MLSNSLFKHNAFCSCAKVSISAVDCHHYFVHHSFEYLLFRTPFTKIARVGYLAAGLDFTIRSLFCRDLK